MDEIGDMGDMSDRDEMFEMDDKSDMGASVGMVDRVDVGDMGNTGWQGRLLTDWLTERAKPVKMLAHRKKRKNTDTIIKKEIWHLI